MPSLFAEHEMKSALKRITAAKSDAEISVSDARTLRAHLDKVIKAHEQATSSTARRAAKLDAALADPGRQLHVQYAAGRLRSIGLDFVKAADVSRLTEAMRAGNFSTTQRIELRKVLADLGVIE
jgi:hypothetical protein